MPEVFRQLCGWFHQDVAILFSSPHEALQRFLAQTSETDKLVLREYLDTLLRRNPSDEEILDVWIDGGAQFVITNPRMREFLAEVLKRLS